MWSESCPAYNRLSAVTARFLSQTVSCGICAARSGTGAGFLRPLWCLLTILFPPFLYTYPSSGAGTMDPLVPGVLSGLTVTPPHPMQYNTTIQYNCVQYSATPDVRFFLFKPHKCTEELTIANKPISEQNNFLRNLIHLYLHRLIYLKRKTF
jgi:hypothetical protein